MKQGQKKKPKRRPGGQPGNNNARKHGFYSYSLTPDEYEQFKFLTEVRHVDPEVAVFHVRYRAIFERGELNAQAVDAAVKYLTAYYRSKFRLSKSDAGVIKQLLKRIYSIHAMMVKANPESFSWEFK